MFYKRFFHGVIDHAKRFISPVLTSGVEAKIQFVAYEDHGISFWAAGEPFSQKFRAYFAYDPALNVLIRIEIIGQSALKREYPEKKLERRRKLVIVIRSDVSYIRDVAYTVLYKHIGTVAEIAFYFFHASLRVFRRIRRMALG